MSVDYSAEYGIGYEVFASEKIAESEEDAASLYEYLCINVSDGFETLQTNDGYDTDVDGIYLVVDKPLKDGLNLTVVKEKLDAEIKRLKLDTCGEFGLVGGMFIC